MPAAVTRMGKVRDNGALYSNAKGIETQTKSSSGGTVKTLGIIALLGVGLILFMRYRDRTQTAPVLTLNAGVAPDQSTIDNLAASIRAIGALPHGGVSTPIAGPGSGGLAARSVSAQGTS